MSGTVLRSLFGCLLPRSLIARVYALYLVALLSFVGLGIGLFYAYQFERQVENSYSSASMVIEIVAQVISDSVLIGDYDTIKRTLDKAIPGSPFASAVYIDLNGGIVRADDIANVQRHAPGWLVAQVAESLPDINRNLVVGGRDYGVLRLRFDWDELAADLWRLVLGALLLGGASLVGGLLLIWFPLHRWLGSLERAGRLGFGKRRTDVPPTAEERERIEDIPLEFRPLFERLAETSANLGQELENREKAAQNLRGLLESMVPDVARRELAEHGDLDAVTRIISELVIEREASRVALDNQKFALDQHAIVSIADRNGRILYANDRFCTSSGYERQELLEQPYDVLHSGVHPPEFFRELWTTVRAGQVWQGEICNRARDGRLLWYASTVVPLAAPGRAPDQFIGISTDITQRKTAEAEAQAARASAEQASIAKSQFLANMSHEIRTPMNGIIGMTELALHTELTVEQRDYLTLVKASADALLEIINDILDFSKIEAGKLTIESVPFDLPELVDTTLRSLQLRADEKSLALKSAFAADVPHGLLGDPGRLRQVLINLLGNAIKFTDLGEVALHVEVAATQPGHVTLHCAVRDTGIGIPPAKQAHIFEAFTQEDASITRKYGGTGLGLSISVRLVELMGGHMWLESEVGRGSTFHFTIDCPLLDAARLEAALPEAVLPDTPAVAEPSPEVPAPAPLPILLVEDNPINQRLAMVLLERRGYRVEHAANGAEALAALERGSYMLVLMDMQMPVMDGLEATRRLRAAEAAGGLPRRTVIAMTANAMQSDRERCLEAGMDDYLSKPIKSAELFALLERWLEAPAG